MGLFWWWPSARWRRFPRTSSTRCASGATAAVVDVRTPAEWGSGHIAGAINAPITELGSRIAGLKLDPKRRSSPSVAARIAASRR